MYSQRTSFSSAENGNSPVIISYNNTPRLHQSTALLCPSPRRNSGALYSAVPTSVFASVVTFAFAKATDGTQSVDPQFSANWAGMKAAGVLRGAYVFYEVGQDPGQQAQDFISTVAMAPGDLPPVIDIERGQSGSASDMIGNLRSYIETLKAHYGLDPIIYTSPGYWNANFDESFADCPLWVAEYGVSAPKETRGWRYWTFWQHTQSGKVPGVSGNVDQNYFNGSLDQLKRFLKD